MKTDRARVAGFGGEGAMEGDTKIMRKHIINGHKSRAKKKNERQTEKNV